MRDGDSGRVQLRTNVNDSTWDSDTLSVVVEERVAEAAMVSDRVSVRVTVAPVPVTPCDVVAVRNGAERDADNVAEFEGCSAEADVDRTTVAPEPETDSVTVSVN